MSAKLPPPGVWSYSAVTFGIFYTIEIVRDNGGVRSNQYAFYHIKIFGSSGGLESLCQESTGKS